jgi:hypothetical protein
MHAAGKWLQDQTKQMDIATPTIFRCVPTLKSVRPLSRPGVSIDTPRPPFIYSSQGRAFEQCRILGQCCAS